MIAYSITPLECGIAQIRESPHSEDTDSVMISSEAAEGTLSQWQQMNAEQHNAKQTGQTGSEIHLLGKGC